MEAPPPPEAPVAASAPARPAPALTSAQRTATLIAALLGTFLAAIDQTIVSTAGPKIIEDLGISPTLYDWLSSSYNLASTVLVPVWGKLSDIKGRKPILLAGIGVFLLGSLGCALAPGFGTLVAFRAVQGAGAAALFTSAFAVVADLFPPAVRGKYTGMFAAMWGISSVIGPLLGGIITDSLSWHWVFLVNLPVGAIAVGFILARMPKLGGGLPSRIDLIGVLTLCAAVVPLLLALTFGRATSHEQPGVLPESHWGEPLVLAMLAAAVLGALAFVTVQRRSRHPVIDLAYFKEPVFRWGVVGTSLLGMAFFTGILFAPLFMQRVIGKSPTDAGLVLMPMTLGLTAGNVLSGQLASRLGRYKSLMLVSVVAMIAAFLWLALTLDENISSAEMMVKMALLGLAMGPSLPLYTLAIQNGMPAQAVGSVTAAVTFFRQIGSTIGTALAGAVFGAVLTSSPSISEGEAMTRAVISVFWVGAGLTTLALLATFFLPGRELRKSH
jgi:EmrB/QacA subfamily drug resistance transporter